MRLRHRLTGILIIALAGVCPWLGGCEASTSEKDIKEGVLASIADVRELIDKREGGETNAVLLIDPRAPKYFAAGHLPGARNLRMPTFPEDAERDPDIQKYQRLVVYGDNPGSAVARGMFKRLLAVGYGGLKFYAGGLDEWRENGFEVETSPAPEPASGR
ncbi:MAG: rhodanese-like domain-containing protein [Phycisphaerales bacterium]|nr:rhodanese-like domain-containing protein [Phycisphaerales bacterium]